EPMPMHSSSEPNNASLISMRSRTYGTRGAHTERPNPAMKKPTRVARRASGEAAVTERVAAGMRRVLDQRESGRALGAGQAGTRYCGKDWRSQSRACAW